MRNLYSFMLKNYKTGIHEEMDLFVNSAKIHPFIDSYQRFYSFMHTNKRIHNDLSNNTFSISDDSNLCSSSLYWLHEHSFVL